MLLRRRLVLWLRLWVLRRWLLILRRLRLLWRLLILRLLLRLLRLPRALRPAHIRLTGACVRVRLVARVRV